MREYVDLTKDYHSYKISTQGVRLLIC